MSVLGVTELVWDVMKDGAKLSTAGKRVNVLPDGDRKQDHSGWEGPVGYTEYFKQVSFLFGTPLADLALTSNWEYNGRYIANFAVDVAGTVAVLSGVDVQAETLEAALDQRGVAELPYRIHLTYSNVTGGVKRVTYSAKARGDGGGLSLGYR